LKPAFEVVRGNFNDFAFLKGIVSADRIDEALVDRFIKVELASYGTFKNASSKMRHVLEYLREQGVIPKSITSGLDDPFVAILAPYDCHLRDVRGLTLVSRSQYLRYARRLLVWLQNHRPGRPLAGTTGVDILEFVSGLAGLHPSGSWRNNLCSLTRVFLRYLRWQGIIEIDLDRVVPKLPRWRLSSLPRHLPWDQVQKLIGSIDASDAVGMRDKAALLLIATLTVVFASSPPGKRVQGTHHPSGEGLGQSLQSAYRRAWSHNRFAGSRFRQRPGKTTHTAWRKPHLAKSGKKGNPGSPRPDLKDGLPAHASTFSRNATAPVGGGPHDNPGLARPRVSQHDSPVYRG